MEVNYYNHARISNLKKYQVFYENKIQKLISQCDQAYALRQVNYKDCEELSKRLGKMISRWKRLTALIIEALLELANEIQLEEKEYNFHAKKHQKLSTIVQKDEEELNNMDNLIALLSHFIHKAELRSNGGGAGGGGGSVISDRSNSGNISLGAGGTPMGGNGGGYFSSNNSLQQPYYPQQQHPSQYGNSFKTRYDL
jgi:hypothetical protein